MRMRWLRRAFHQQERGHRKETSPMLTCVRVVARFARAKGKFDALAALRKILVSAVKTAYPVCLVYRPHRSTKIRTSSSSTSST